MNNRGSWRKSDYSKVLLLSRIRNHTFFGREVKLFYKRIKCNEELSTWELETLGKVLQQELEPPGPRRTCSGRDKRE